MLTIPAARMESYLPTRMNVCPLHAYAKRDKFSYLAEDPAFAGSQIEIAVQCLKELISALEFWLKTKLERTRSNAMKVISIAANVLSHRLASGCFPVQSGTEFTSRSMPVGIR